MLIILPGSNESSINSDLDNEIFLFAFWFSTWILDFTSDKYMSIQSKIKIYAV